MQRDLKSLGPARGHGQFAPSVPTGIPAAGRCRKNVHATNLSVKQIQEQLEGLQGDQAKAIENEAELVQKVKDVNAEIQELMQKALNHSVHLKYLAEHEKKRNLKRLPPRGTPTSSMPLRQYCRSQTLPKFPNRPSLRPRANW